MEEDYRKKEEEFLQENKRLELKTKELFQKVSEMKMMQDYQIQSTALVETKDLNVPKSVDEMSAKGMIHFYKSKLKTLQDNFEKVQNELKNKNEELKKVQKGYQTAVEEKEKWFLQYNVQKNGSTKMEKQIAVLTSKLQLKENENAAMEKEVEQLKQELKMISNELMAAENRLKLKSQENEKLKASLKSLRQQEKETKALHQTNINELTSAIKQIQKHKNELLQGYKKQMQLIDNLKKQKAHIESCKVLELAENEFFKLLDWKLD